MFFLKTCSYLTIGPVKMAGLFQCNVNCTTSHKMYICTFTNAVLHPTTQNPHGKKYTIVQSMIVWTSVCFRTLRVRACVQHLHECVSTCTERMLMPYILSIGSTIQQKNAPKTKRENTIVMNEGFG